MGSKKKLKKIRFELMKSFDFGFTIQCFKPLNYFFIKFKIKKIFDPRAKHVGRKAN